MRLARSSTGNGWSNRAEGYGATFDPPPPGAYQVRVAGYGSARAEVTPVTAGVLVWDQP